MHKISYRKRWDSNGTLYRQRVRVSKDMYKEIERAIALEIKKDFNNKDFYCQSCGDNYVQFYLKAPELINNIAILNLTMKNFINFYFKFNLKDMNTYILVN